MSNVSPTTIQSKASFLKNDIKRFLSIEIKPSRIIVLFILLTAGLIISLKIFLEVTKSNYENLVYGMSMQEVQGIMGRPFLDWNDNEQVQWSYPISKRGDQVQLIFHDCKLIGLSGGKGVGENFVPDIEKQNVVWSAIIRHNPNDAKAYLKRGQINYYRHKFDESIADLTEAIRIDPDNPSAYFLRSEDYRIKGEIEKAEADLSKRKDLLSSPNKLFNFE